MQVRALVVASILVTSAIGGAAGLLTVDKAQGEDGTSSSIEQQGQGHSVVLTDDALPAQTGFAALAVQIPVNTSVQIEESMDGEASSADGTVVSTFLTSRNHTPLILPRTSRDEARAHVSLGEQITAEVPSGRTDDFSEDGDTWAFNTTEPVHLTAGLIAQAWPEDADYRLEIRSENKPLSIEAAPTGTDVHAVDLVEQARKQGTYAGVHGEAIVSQPDDVHRAWSIDHTGIVGLDAWIQGPARADLSLELPNGTQVTTNDGRNETLMATAATGSGNLTVALENVHDPGFVEERRDGFGILEAHVLVADIPLNLTGMYAEVDESEEDDVQLEPHPERVTFNESKLPAPTGWFLATITANRTSEVVVATETNQNGTREETVAHAPLILSKDSLLPFATVIPEPSLASANAQGERVTCCPVPSERDRVWASTSGESERRLEVGPNQPVYVGLAAVGFDGEDRFETIVQPSPDANATDLQVQRVQTGGSVRAVDLVQRAKEAGTNVNVGNTKVAGQAGEAHVSFKPDEGGLVIAHYYVSGPDAEGQTMVELPNGTTIESDAKNTAGGVQALTGPGEVTLRFTEVKIPNAADRVGRESSYLGATALLVDLPLPFQSLFTHEDTVDS